MKTSLMLVTAAVASLSLGVVAAHAGPHGGGMGGGGGMGVSTHTPGYEMRNYSGSNPPPHGASTYSPGYQMRNYSGTNPPPRGASSYAPGTYAPGHK